MPTVKKACSVPWRWRVSSGASGQPGAVFLRGWQSSLSQLQGSLRGSPLRPQVFGRSEAWLSVWADRWVWLRSVSPLSCPVGAASSGSVWALGWATLSAICRSSFCNHPQSRPGWVLDLRFLVHWLCQKQLNGRTTPRQHRCSLHGARCCCSLLWSGWIPLPFSSFNTLPISSQALGVMPCSGATLWSTWLSLSLQAHGCRAADHDGSAARPTCCWLYRHFW